MPYGPPYFAPYYAPYYSPFQRFPDTTWSPSDIPQAEADALIAFYDATGGSSWTNDWTFSGDAGDLYGVTVSGGSVTHIELPNNNLDGDVSSLDMSALSLTILNCQNNSNLSGVYGTYFASQIEDFISNESYIPIATATELAQLQNADSRTYGSGTDWEDSYTGGLDKKYVLLADIDLEYDTQDPSGDFYDGGNGWRALGDSTSDIFTGTFDGAGRFITEMYTSQPSTFTGLFGAVNSVAVIKNLALEGQNITQNQPAQLLCITYGSPDGVDLDNILVAGRAYSPKTGNNIGAGGLISGDDVESTVDNCFVVVAVQTPDSRIGGAFSDFKGIANDVISIGSVINDGSNSHGGLSGYTPGTINTSYYNTETSGQTDDTGEGSPETTSDLLSGTPSESIFTGWDTALWEFTSDRYPIQRLFGEQAVHRAPPVNLAATPDGADIVLTWDDASSETDEPDGYFVYQSVDNAAWEKLNSTALANKTYTVSSPAAGEYNFFITAYYNDVTYQIQETGNSVTATETIT